MLQLPVDEVVVRAIKNSWSLIILSVLAFLSSISRLRLSTDAAAASGRGSSQSHQRQLLPGLFLLSHCQHLCPISQGSDHLVMLQLPVDEVIVRAIKYSSCLDVIDSDHKPVWALLALDVPVTNQEKKRRMCSHILKHTAAQGQAPASPALQLSSDTVSLSQV